MKFSAFIFGTLLACAGLLSAQEETPLPRYELGLTYSGVHSSAAHNDSQITENGGSGQFVYNFNRWLGGVADLGGYANTRSGIDEKTFSYLFGPRVSWRHNRLIPYAQALFGGSNAWSGTNSNSQNAFTLALGGGLDYRLTRHIAIKPVQVEYFRSQFDSARLGGATSNFGGHQNGIRYSAGIVLLFGSK